MPRDELVVAADMYRRGYYSYATDRFIYRSELVGGQFSRHVPSWMRADIEEAEDRHRALFRALQRIRAHELIQKQWFSEGGAKSRLGLPTFGTRILPFQDPNGGPDWIATFRSGRIVLNDMELQVEVDREMLIDFVGLECNVRQEAADEIYGVCSLIGPANRVLETYKFPGGDETIRMGPEGLRFWPHHRELYRGPVQAVTFVGALVEHDDFTDVDAAAQRIADKIAEKAGELLGALTGLPAESVSEETWFKDGLGAALGLVMDDILGMGDDPYNGATVSVHMTEIGEWGPARQPPRTRSDDNQRIENWTTRLKVHGTDDGGDLGDYDFYFDIRVRGIIEPIRRIQVPPGQ